MNDIPSAAERQQQGDLRHPGLERGPSAQGVARTYGLFAPVYDTVFGWVLEPGRRAMTQAARALQPGSVLEVGVGTGLTLGGYPPQARVVGIDLSAEMLERARRRAGRMPDRDISLQLMNAERMEFEDDSFDCVAAPYVLSVTPHPARLVHEMRRVCRGDGVILIVNHFSGSRFWWLMERAVRSMADRIGFRSDFSYEEHILSHDWRVEAVQAVNLFRLSRIVVLRNTK
ncbi:MAG TPA: methyltransferase domain-containing protein [Burkholderiaceae bacterium]|nr:methyltransferase domain-containing protein [Burkholderiaceae bacterium]